MDDKRFDAFARGLAGRLSRRSAWQGALGGLLGLVGLAASVGDADAQGRNQRVRGQHCLPNGAVCRPRDLSRPNRQGTNHRHRCGSCCSKFSVPAGRSGRGRKCACRPAGKVGTRAQCCSGLVRNGRCALPAVTTGLIEDNPAVGTLSVSGPTRTFTGRITGTPINGTFNGSLTLANVRPDPLVPSIFLADATGTITLSEVGTGATLNFTVSTPLVGLPFAGPPPGIGWFTPFGDVGTYTITGGTGRFAGATGTGGSRIGFDESGTTGTFYDLMLQGTVTTLP